jgi:hypothetical protein
LVFSFSTFSADKPESAESGDSQSAKTKSDEIPRGYIEEVASSMTIRPGQEIFFSIPVNHLSKRWHVEIPFEFELPKGKGPRDPTNGGTPMMVVQYYLWDLPSKSRAEIGEN